MLLFYLEYSAEGDANINYILYIFSKLKLNMFISNNIYDSTKKK